MIHCELINYTPNPEKTIAMAGKLCYSSSNIYRLLDSLDEVAIEQFNYKLMDMGHQSPLEHVSFTFAIEGVSRALTHQLVRHRIASYSQQSQRYVNENNFEYIVPPSIAKNQRSISKFTNLMTSINRIYNELIDAGIPKEDARYILPNATETKIIATFNIRSLLHFFSLRCCNRAQWEIRILANLMLAEVKKIAPLLFKNAGPACKQKGYCPEGKMSCGIVPTLDFLLDKSKKGE